MKRPITLFSGQFADLSLAEFAAKTAGWGYDGVELAAWGNHFNVVRALEDDNYVAEVRKTLDDHGLSCSVVTAHLVSQAVCDRIDDRHKPFLPPAVWGDGDPEGVRRRAEERMKDTARAAARFGADTVVGFTGSSIFHYFNGWPPASPEQIQAGYDDFAERWGRILDVCEEVGVRYALEVMPGEIAYDIATTHRALEAIGRESFGINFDPTHLHWQMVDEVAYLREFGDRIYHVHCKDAKRQLTGTTSILGSHLPSGDPGRGWDFVSVGHGDVPFEAIVRTLNQVGYEGPLSVEWEDSLMDREFGAEEAVQFLRKLTFEAPRAAWFSAFSTPE
ncbi:MAG: Xylose isomerase domain protein barrel [Conexibacter sp.]|jgi:sugar phosphate isomerase/epimerase|nr:Xylose isomerase domain protein barrel [Conexibacter sp.]